MKVVVEADVNRLDIIPLHHLAKACIDIWNAILLRDSASFSFVYICNGNDLCIGVFGMTLHMLLTDLTNTNDADSDGI